MKSIDKSVCLRCDEEMKCLGVESVQLGHTGFFTGSLSNILSGSLETEIWICKTCGKIDFYSTDEKEKEEYSKDLQVECKYCGKIHDIDDLRCPFCYKGIEGT